MKDAFEPQDFLNEYNELISQAGLEHNNCFAVLASPTLNKQETVTFLYRNITAFNNIAFNKPDWKERLYEFVFFLPLLAYHFFHLLRISMRFRIKSLPPNSIYIRSWLVPRTIRNGKLHDDYFRDLAKDLTEKYNVVNALQPLNYGKELSAYKNIRRKENFIIPIGLLSPKDIFLLLFKYIFTARIQVRKPYLFKGEKINAIINRSLRKDFYKFRSLQAYLEQAIAQKIKKRDSFWSLTAHQGLHGAELLTENKFTLNSRPTLHR